MCDDHSNDRVYLPNSKTCFVCGEENFAGLKLRFFVEGAAVKAVFSPMPHHCGYANVVHGGIVAALLDETMGWAANRAMARMTLTGELTVRYLKPVPGDRESVVSAEITRQSKRMVHVAAAVGDGNGTTYARAEGRFLPLSAEETRVIDSHLLYRGGEERVFASLYEGENTI
ncbi:MAG: PaaI family thioesterase [Candidatus Hydrogenedentales bacterium]|jgi:uncharacterized protein (TIGR00369 family)